MLFGLDECFIMESNRKLPPNLEKVHDLLALNVEILNRLVFMTQIAFSFVSFLFFWNTKTKTIHNPPICLCQSHSLPYLQRTLDRAFHSPINPSVCLICDNDTFCNSCSCFFIHFFLLSHSPFFISSVVLSWYFVGFIHPNRESYETASVLIRIKPCFEAYNCLFAPTTRRENWF